MESDEEDFVFFGTPIEREEDITSRKKKSIAEAYGQLRTLAPWKHENGTPKPYSFEPHRFRERYNLLGFMTKWRSAGRRRLGGVVAAGAEISNPFSVNIGLDSQVSD